MPRRGDEDARPGQTTAVRIDTDADQLLGLFTPPAGGARRMPTLICGPWGWSEVASYRSRRDWALRLAATGAPTLRLDLPAVGDSTGAPAEGGLVARWVGAVAAASRWLAGATEVTAVAVVGLELGGLLALESLAAGAPISDLAVWAIPANGRRFVREQRAFSRLQAWNGGHQDEGFDPGVPEGWLEAGGFVLAPGTLEELAALDPAPRADGPLRRVLALDRDGIEIDRGLLAKIEAENVAVSRVAGPGWGDFASHPEEGVLPEAVAASLDDWLAGAEPRRDAPRPAAVALPGKPVEITAAAGVRERVIDLTQDWGRPFGVAAEPADPAAASGGDLWAIFANAGAVRHVGPSRMWVELGRAAAAAGVRALRLDLQGVGEADGEAAGVLRGGAFNAPRFERQLRAVLDRLAADRGARHFVLVGLCAGGHNSFRVADDPRVVATLLVNASGLRWDDELPAVREARKVGRALDRSWISRFMRGEVKLRRLWAVARSALRWMATSPARLRRPGRSFAAQLEADVDRVAATRTRVVLAFSGDEPLDLELRATGVAAKVAATDGFETRTLPGRDHTLRPLSAQRAVKELILAEIAAAAERVAGPEAAPR